MRVQVRVVHGKEPAQFVGIWNGSMVVYDGGVASGFKNLQEDSSEGAADGATKLFQVCFHIPAGATLNVYDFSSLVQASGMHIM